MAGASAAAPGVGVGLFLVLALSTLTPTFSCAQTSDLYSAINRMRAGQGDCAFAGNLPALKVQPALERAALALSQGGDLQKSLKDASYRATQARMLNLTGNAIDSRAATLLAQRYCRELQERTLSEIGLYLDARQLWIVLAAPFAPSVALSAQAAGQRVLELVNQARAEPRKYGDKAFGAARPLRWNDTLAHAALLHAGDMAQQSYFSHTGRDGSTPAQRVARAGYRYRATGENIAAGQPSPEDAVASWIKSPGHCANLMSPAYTEMGSAFAVNAKSEMGVYWAQLFGAPRLTCGES
jgi:uncharacterized protein YkwD